jgi:hypothetical protein
MWRHSKIRYPLPLPSLLSSPPRSSLLSPRSTLTFSLSFPTHRFKCSFLPSSSNYGVSISWNFQGSCSWFYLLLLIEAPNVNFFVCASGGAHSRIWSHYLCASGGPHQGALFWCACIVHVLLLVFQNVHVLLLHLCCTCCLLHLYCASIFAMLMFRKVVFMVLDLHGLVLLFNFWPPCVVIMFLAFLRCCFSTLDLFMVPCFSILDLLMCYPSNYPQQLLLFFSFLCSLSTTTTFFFSPLFILSNNCWCYSFFSFILLLNQGSHPHIQENQLAYLPWNYRNICLLLF